MYILWLLQDIEYHNMFTDLILPLNLGHLTFPPLFIGTSLFLVVKVKLIFFISCTALVFFTFIIIELVFDAKERD